MTIGSRWIKAQQVPYIAQRKTLISDWCQLARTHSVGDLAFDRRGYLLASAGDGAVEAGPQGDQKAMCAPKVPEEYAGSEAALDALAPKVSPSLNGKIIRINPATGEGAPGNPWSHSSDPNRRRIVAVGFRNPYRLATNPDKNELAITLVGMRTRESVWTMPLRDRSRTVYNAAWPCSEAGWKPDRPAASSSLCADTGLLPATKLVPTGTWN